MARLLVIVLCLAVAMGSAMGFAPANPPNPAAPTTSAPASAALGPPTQSTLQIGQGHQRVTVILSQLPPVRVRATFERLDVPDAGASDADVKDDADTRMTGGASHADLTWDPQVSSRLSRTAYLNPGRWAITFWADPTPIPWGSPANPKNAIFSFGALAGQTVCDGSGNAKVQAVANYWVLADRASDAGIHGELEAVKISNMPSISATASCGPLLTLDDTIGNSFSTSQGGVVGGRSFEELAGKAVTDALQLLAEIAYERAQAKGFALVQAQAIDLLCTRLLWPPRSTEVVHPAQYRWLLPQSGTGSTRTLTAAEVKADDRILPNSCEFVQRARIQDIASRGKDALQALERDILYIALRGAEPSLVEIEPAARAFVRSASQALLELLQHSTISARTPQLLLTQASRIAMDGRTLAQLAAATATTVAPVDAIAKDNEAQAKKNQFNHDAYVCGLKLAFAAMAQCHASDNCDVRLISQLVNQPWEFFSDGTCLSNKTLKEVRDLWPDLELLVARGMEVIGPMPGASPLQMLRDTMDLTLELAARSWAFVGGDIEPKNRLPFAYLRDLREVADALIDRAPQHALVAASGVVERVFERYRIDRANFPDSVKQSRKSVAALRRATGILTAILTLVDLREMRAAESDSPEAGKSREANRDARKKAMESLIDSATDRSNREREWVASFGAAVGGFGGGQWIGEANGFRPNWMYPQLALPIGFSLQYLPPSTAVGVGFSASLTFADLGQYIAYKKDGAVAAARWDTFFAPGLQVGAMIGTSSTSFMLTLDGRYAPTLYTERESGPGAFRLGLGLTYFVPFWDFN